MDDYEIPKQNKSLKNIAFLILACLAVAFLVTMVYYFTQINKAASSESRQETVVVAKGLSTRKIADMLASQNVINSPTVFIIYSTLHQAGSKIQAGTYSLNANMTIPVIIDVLTHGKVVSDARTVTLLEGWNNNQIGKYLVDRQIVDNMQTWTDTLKHDGFDAFREDKLAANLDYQGFLFPDTYKLGKDETAKDLVLKMLFNFDDKVLASKVYDSQKQNQSLEQIIILASIIEKEVGRNKQALTADDLSGMQNERTLVASVFYNRLKAGMPLESDATVNYITGKADRSVTIADTKIKSPYNTYQTKGLPPGPICNPGLGAILAAINPANSDYLYFLNAPDGTAYFAKTLAEHNANKAKYLK